MTKRHSFFSVYNYKVTYMNSKHWYSLCDSDYEGSFLIQDSVEGFNAQGLNPYKRAICRDIFDRRHGIIDACCVICHFRHVSRSGKDKDSKFRQVDCC